MAPVDPRELVSVSGQDNSPAQGTCRGCGYDLKGLRKGDRCPECGKAIEPARRPMSKHDNLAEAPRGYLTRLRVSCLLMSVSAIGVICLFLVDLVLAQGAAQIVARSIGLGVMIAWPAGVWGVTAPRRSAVVSEETTRREQRVVRWITRWSQMCLPVVTLFLLAQAVGALGSTPQWALNVLEGVITGLVVAALIGTITLAVVLANLAQWANDEDLSERFWFSVWALAAGALFLVFQPLVRAAFAFLNISLLGAFLMVLAGLGFIAGMIVYAVGLVQLSRQAKWAISSAKRLDERRARDAERLAAARDASPPPPEGVEEPMELKAAPAAWNSATAESDAPRPAPTRSTEPRLDASGEADPYELEP